eukprot:SAG31_NODE_4108_length_3576_cov_1.978142_3_plen_644_part_00
MQCSACSRQGWRGRVRGAVFRTVHGLYIITYCMHQLDLHAAPARGRPPRARARVIAAVMIMMRRVSYISGGAQRRGQAWRPGSEAKPQYGRHIMMARTAGLPSARHVHVLMVLVLALITADVSAATRQLPCAAIGFHDSRFSVLTADVIRIEHHPDCASRSRGAASRFQPFPAASRGAGTTSLNSACFDDLPSTTFTNRAPPASGRVCDWSVASGTLEINTSALALRYSGGPLTDTSLSIINRHSGLVWKPSMGDENNLNGSLVSTDCGAMAPLTPEICIQKYQAMLQPGLLSRTFGVLIDDTHSFLLDGDPAWPPYGWRTRRASRPGYTDHMFFGHGRNYRSAMSDFVTLSGQVALMPARVYNFMYSDHQGLLGEPLKAMVKNFTANELPLTYLVMDMEWHTTSAKPPPDGQKGCNLGNDPGLPREYHCAGGYGGFNWDRTKTSDPAAFQRWIHMNNLSLMLNVHDQCGYDKCQRGYQSFRQAVPGMAALPPNATVPCQFENPGLQEALFTHMLENGENAGVDAWWTDLGDMSRYGNLSTWAPGTNENWRCPDDSPPIGNGTRQLFTPATFWAAYVKASRLIKRAQRGFSLGVYGGLGHHRMPLVGSGDTVQVCTLFFPRILWKHLMHHDGRRGRHSHGKYT